MTVARKHIVDVHSTPYYLVTNRCVRRAFLCGYDAYSGQSYEHRRQQIVNLMTDYASVFALDLCGFAVMSNHYHIVLRLDPDAAKSWTTKDVLSRWCTAYKGPVVVQQYLQGTALNPQQLDTVNTLTETYRERLCDLSWFMAKLNETIARQANKEDGCSGRFWQGRYDARALLDETALITAMMYVDLNPIRAGMATTKARHPHATRCIPAAH
jgi:REP-associated tyrosine transposase